MEKLARYGTCSAAFLIFLIFALQYVIHSGINSIEVIILLSAGALSTLLLFFTLKE